MLNIGAGRGAPPPRPPHGATAALRRVQTRGRCGRRRGTCGPDQDAPAIRECEVAGERCHPAGRLVKPRVRGSSTGVSALTGDEPAGGADACTYGRRPASGPERTGIDHDGNSRCSGAVGHVSRANGGQRRSSRIIALMVPAESATLNGKQAISRP